MMATSMLKDELVKELLSLSKSKPNLKQLIKDSSRNLLTVLMTFMKMSACRIAKHLFSSNPDIKMGKL